ncbi:hypothetical protein B0H34DRAFT_665445 [Crassisporium funariophilum]|nr:hypothetical protein B0H34DRAFT_665445 [Crassisporium funariophilum]
MASTSIYANPATKPKLDPAYYDLHGDELAFYKQQTGIEDDDELKKHIIKVQGSAYQVYGYPCIRRFAFLGLKISKLPGYKQALQLLKTREHPILLDIGCCFGNDARKAVVDGWPVEDVIASDLQKAFWDYGHELFNSTPESFPAAFVPGDAFSPTHIAPRGPFIASDDITELKARPRPDLHGLTSLTPLQGMISAIHASSFFHLFQEDKQLELAKLVGSLLSPEPGSVIFGQHVSQAEKGFKSREIGTQYMFCHSPESWRELWEEQVFGGGGRVKVDAELITVERRDIIDGLDGMVTQKFQLINWCVTRL